VLDEATEATVACTVLYGPIILSLRRPAHEVISTRLYRTEPPACESAT
jgi:hypothetical protein